MEREQLRLLRTELKELRQERKDYLKRIKGRYPTGEEVEGAWIRQRRIHQLEMTHSVVPRKKLKFQRLVLISSEEEEYKGIVS